MEIHFKKRFQQFLGVLIVAAVCAVFVINIQAASISPQLQAQITASQTTPR